MEDSEDTNDAPNKNFRFTEEHLLEFREGINYANRDCSKYMKVLRYIKSLLGMEVVVESAKDGNITWRVVEATEENEFIG